MKKKRIGNKSLGCGSVAQETFSMHEALVWPLPIKDKRKKPKMPPKQINVIEKNQER